MAEQVRSLLQSLPSLLAMVVVVKLVMNELLHIIVEPVKMETEVTDEKILEIVRRYTAEYGGPATWADVVYYFAPEQVRSVIARWWNSEAGRRAEQEVRQRLESLATQGRLRRVEGGYLPG